MHARLKYHSEAGSDCHGRLEFKRDGPCEEDPTKFCEHYTCLGCRAPVVVRRPQSKHTLDVLKHLHTGESVC